MLSFQEEDSKHWFLGQCSEICALPTQVEPTTEGPSHRVSRAPQPEWRKGSDVEKAYKAGCFPICN